MFHISKLTKWPVSRKELDGAKHNREIRRSGLTCRMLQCNKLHFMRVSLASTPHDPKRTEKTNEIGGTTATMNKRISRCSGLARVLSTWSAALPCLCLFYSVGRFTISTNETDKLKTKTLLVHSKHLSGGRLTHGQYKRTKQRHTTLSRKKLTTREKNASLLIGSAI